MRGFVAKNTENAAQRLLRRISDRLDADRDKPRGFRRSQQGLADKLGISKGALSDLLHGPASSRGLMAHLDKIAEYFGVPPSLLIHKNDTALMEIEQAEYRLIQHWRSFPPDVQEQLASMFDYFAGILPEEKEERRIWQRWRRLSPANRARMEAMLQDTLKAEQLAKRATRAGAADADRTAESPAPGQRLPRSGRGRL